MGVIWRRGICGGFCMGFFDSSRRSVFQFIIPNRIKQWHTLPSKFGSRPSRRTAAKPGDFPLSPVLKTRLRGGTNRATCAPMTPLYTELQVTTNYSFLRGASHIEELMARAAVLRMKALAVTDRNSLAGIVRAHQRAKEAGIRLIVGCRLDLKDGPSVLVYPTSRAGYSRLTRLLTQGKGRAGKGKCELYWPDLAAASEDLIGILCTAPTEENLRCLKADFSATVPMSP